MKFPQRIIWTLVLFATGTSVSWAQSFNQTTVYVPPFVNQTQNAAVDTLGAIIVSEMRLTIALLDGFLLVEDASEAEIQITATMDIVEGGVYRSSSAVIQDGTVVADFEQLLPSVFDVFDAGGEAGERLLSIYTDQELEFARLTIVPSRFTDGLEISIDNQALAPSSLQLERVLVGTRRIEARLAGAVGPFYAQDILLEPDTAVRVSFDVPALNAADYQSGLRTYLSGQLLSRQPEEGNGGLSRQQRSGLAEFLALREDGTASLEAPAQALAELMSRYDAVRGGFTMPWFQDGMVNIDGFPDEWGSVPVHNGGSGDVRGAKVIDARFAHDQGQFYGLVGVEDVDQGDGIEVSVIVYDGPGRGHEAARINIPMARRDAESGVLLKAFAEVGGSWTDRYQTQTTAIYRDGYFEFAVPMSTLRAPGLTYNSAGMPDRVSVDIEAGVRINGSDFDYQLYGYTGARTLNAIMDNAE